ncbi:hypothetical protein AC739_14480 [Planococcus glaciei]|uniref:hypothetical protein n=1 Tax=Planococcus glaciei TaxID=459472 RepID=UPI00069D821E|nr:hypothetical protein [Planococcus glaciei]KOF09481.1 hypothetical protein AC739_14480 [Planococcus glaciei]
MAVYPNNHHSPLLQNTQDNGNLPYKQAFYFSHLKLLHPEWFRYLFVALPLPVEVLEAAGKKNAQRIRRAEFGYRLKDYD